ncbi:PREDICTED: E3 ubiquitin-protein ligase parkin-like isoform X2 [Priapulus caudatus]|uniref:E3 ubiquitin-protein ligase parkin n=1 Tax=Priapulus caudatus TaxID=37621 RepID=A0ABM1EAT1_PRICU|nr:PREDICTED: E3 ubiquitin-protein ligase parkin-like isoform X2 [Priapulus caudatus]
MAAPMGATHRMEEPSTVHITVKLGINRVLPVTVPCNWNVGQLKELLHEQLDLDQPKSLPLSQIKILFAGRELSDEFIFKDSDFGQHTVVNAVYRPITQNIMSTVEEPHWLLTSSEDRYSSLVSSSTAAGQSDHGARKLFYVYCKEPSCRRIQPGKLRVRCRTCGEATLSISKEPNCWDDVLTPGRIAGICHREGCDGTVAEFYFKCSVHASVNERESMVVLPLIRPNTLNIPCLACTDTRDVVIVFPCDDGHVMCLDCFREYCFTMLNDKLFIHHPIYGFTLPCPVKCPESYIRETHHFRILGEEQYERYQRFATEGLLLSDGGVLCPSPGCGEGFLPDTYVKNITCLTCGFQFCRNCNEKYHIGACNQLDAETGSTRVPSCSTCSGIRD